MNSSILEDKQKKIYEVTRNYVNKIASYWFQMFTDEIYEKNLDRLEEHVKRFYEELQIESLEKKEFVESEIQEFEEEAKTLRRLLKVDFELKPPQNVPLTVIRTELDKSLAELRERLQQRKEQIYELLLEQDTLCDELGETPQPLVDDPLPNEIELNDFRMHLDTLKTEKVNRLYEISNLRRDIKGFLKSLEITLESEDEISLVTDQNIPLTKITLSRLTQIHNKYLNHLVEVRESIQTMHTKLESHWDRLGASPSVREKFTKYKVFSQTTYDKFYQELDRWETLKRQNIKRFVDQIRDEIVLWWEKTLKSDVERSRFSNFTNDCYTDYLLALHEMELDDLKQHYNSNEKIYDLINERKTLWDRMSTLEAKASEPNRYNNRGGQLLKEEKERKTIASKLPKIEAQLTELVNTYETEHNRKFLINGENILEVIASDWDKKREVKEKLMSARKNGLTPLAKNVSIRTPLSSRNPVSASMRRIPSATNVSWSASNKRKVPPNKYLNPSAKRSLMEQLNSPSVFLRPTSGAQKTPFKSPLKKKLIATTISSANRRRSGRKSINAKKRRSIRTPVKPPGIYVTNMDTDGAVETDDYNSFKQYIQETPGARSSILHSAGQLTRTTRNRKKIVGNQTVINLPNPQLCPTPTKINLKQSTALSRTANSPVPGTSGRKLTTKKLPILI